MDADCYLERLGLARVDVEARDRDALERLQRAHVRAVPFENLSIAGDPVGAGSEGAEQKERAGVSLDLEDLYPKVVERERGGFCYELNGLFSWLLAELGFQTERLAARVLDDDGRARPPANHHTNAVTLDRRYVVDVGVAVPTIRQPLPLDGSVREDEVGVEVVDLRTLSPMDRGTLVDSFRKTGRAVVVHEAPRTGGLAGEAIATLQEEALLYQETPVGRVTGWEAVCPLYDIGDFQLPNAARVREKLREVVAF